MRHTTNGGEKMEKLIAMRTQRLSSAEYIEKVKTATNRNNIKNVRFVPPVLGSNDFGSFEVEYKRMEIVSTQHMDKS